MSRMAFWYGFAVFSSACSINLHGQQVAENFADSFSVQPVQPYPGQPMPPQSYSTEGIPGQHEFYAQQGQACNQGNSGGCNCPACTQQPSACWTTYYRNTRWPSPFKLQDINAVSSYFAVQRENGWKMHNTLGHILFDAQTNCLTDAGKNHIRSILGDNPLDRRTVFVLQGQTPKQTAERIESVQLAISALIPAGDLPAIYVTDRDAPGSSGAYQTAVTRAMMTSIPAPRLPTFNASQGTP